MSDSAKEGNDEMPQPVELPNADLDRHYAAVARALGKSGIGYDAGQLYELAARAREQLAREQDHAERMERERDALAGRLAARPPQPAEVALRELIAALRDGIR